MGFAKEFREFILKGSVVDLAVGVIIGAAFGAVVKSAVDDLMMPPLGYLMGGVDFGDKTLKISVPPLPGTTIAAKEIEIRYGKFLNVLLALAIQGVSIFVVIKVMNKLRKPAPAPAAGPPPLTKDQELLVEIRDLLKRSPK
jgi:large conductance mechanosensitive channel